MPDTETRRPFYPVTIDPERDLLTRKELAFVLRVSRRYVDAMCARGFTMPAGTATLTEARTWLRENPSPRGRLT